ncbi:MAG: heavy metal-associated domain-containing protein [Acidocella sp.]|nr:heavy metal-associated domain-containing protein [Acidocella sp.]
MTQVHPHQFDVPDMDCSGCVASIERAVHKLDAAATVSADLTTKRVVVGSTAATPDIKAAIEGAGFDVRTAA